MENLRLARARERETNRNEKKARYVNDRRKISADVYVHFLPFDFHYFVFDRKLNRRRRTFVFFINTHSLERTVKTTSSCLVFFF